MSPVMFITLSHHLEHDRMMSDDTKTDFHTFGERSLVVVISMHNLQLGALLELATVGTTNFLDVL